MRTASTERSPTLENRLAKRRRRSILFGLLLQFFLLVLVQLRLMFVQLLLFLRLFFLRFVLLFLLFFGLLVRVLVAILRRVHVLVPIVPDKIDWLAAGVVPVAVAAPICRLAARDAKVHRLAHDRHRW